MYGKASLPQALSYYVTSTDGKMKKFIKYMEDQKIHSVSHLEKLKQYFEMIKEPTFVSKYKWSSEKAKKI